MSSGSFEVVSDLDQLLDDAVVAKDDNETEKNKMLDELMKRGKTLMKAGVSIPEMTTEIKEMIQVEAVIYLRHCLCRMPEMLLA